ncbi:permease-like cell division protein FtsX [Catelliglobosispora koreensis]|uniref:permease-like cell division protein FtsX n=1 Tax=Catelliglobosispora koreensis TaxID=129052 RepID=UPI00036A1712|nr:permease-like cell division protein FtsX [Catelliglobosispora koreensis]
MRAKYVLAEVLVGLWRNVTMTIAMMITMTVSLSMLGASLLMYLQVEDMKEYYYSQVEVSIYLKTDVTPEQRTEIQTKLDTDELVEKVDYESKEAAYENFKKLFHDAKAMVDSVGPNEMPESFRVSLKDPTQFRAIDEGYRQLPGVQSVVDQQQLLAKVFDVLGAIQSMSLVVAAVMGIAALLLVANTIQVAAYSKRREVAVMKLVGASNWFIQMPFVLEAVFAALLGAILAGVMLVLAKVFLLDGSLAALTNLLTPVTWGDVLLMFPVLAGIGGVVSAVTAWITLRFYIRV